MSKFSVVLANETNARTFLVQIRISGSYWALVQGRRRMVAILQRTGWMKFTIMVVDVFVRFRLSAIERSPRRPQTWQLQLLTIEQVAEVLVSLGFLERDVARRLTDASTTITPQAGLVTVPFTDIVAVTQFVHHEDDPPSPDAQQGHVLIVQGETTEEALAAAGFVMKVDGPLQ